MHHHSLGDLALVLELTLYPFLSSHNVFISFLFYHASFFVLSLGTLLSVAMLHLELAFQPAFPHFSLLAYDFQLALPQNPNYIFSSNVSLMSFYYNTIIFKLLNQPVNTKQFPCFMSIYINYPLQVIIIFRFLKYISASPSHELHFTFFIVQVQVPGNAKPSLNTPLFLEFQSAYWLTH